MFKRKLTLLILMLAAALPSVSSDALDIAGNDLILPIVARTPGAYGSEWRTDVIVTNASRRMIDVPVTVTFHRSGGEPLSFSTTLQPRGSIALHDAVLDVFGLHEASGLIRVTSTIPNARLTARSRIYNVGGVQGEFGQTSQAIPASMLGTEIYLSGLEGLGANRTNVGIANPSAAEANAFLSLFEEDGTFRGGFSTAIPPSSVVQFNNIFSHFQAGPLDHATLVVTSSTGVYAYGSVVRSDSGDADFVTGIGGSLDDSIVLTPACAEPAPLQLARPGYEAEGWIVLFHEGVNAAQAVAELSSRLPITPTRIYQDAFAGFVADLGPETIAALRCEPTVQYIQQNELVPLP